MVKREVLPDGSVELTAGGCSITLSRPRSGALLVAIKGYDEGDLGDAPFDWINAEIARSGGPVELHVDLRAAVGAKTEVREAWTRWFQEHGPETRSIAILVASKFLQVAAEVVRLFSRTGDRIKIFTDAEAFDQAVSGASRSPARGA
ncbi:MAG TPA: hypothetical protein VE093_43000 [Polyangiaceae bacterium]|jgi:hypothetical protein|nr:hypothetical protein [Polyangiaceae bacterium]